jgi:competence protein ComEA
MTASLRVATALGLLGLLGLLASGLAHAYGKPGAEAAARPGAQALPAAKAPAVVRLVDLNSASRADLKTLPGIDDAAADRIVAARPYPSKAKLVADQVISMELFLSLKDRVVALQQPRLRTNPHASRQP